MWISEQHFTLMETAMKEVTCVFSYHVYPYTHVYQCNCIPINVKPYFPQYGEYEDYSRDWCEVGFHNFIAYVMCYKATLYKVRFHHRFHPGIE